MSTKKPANFGMTGGALTVIQSTREPLKPGDRDSLNFC